MPYEYKFVDLVRDLFEKIVSDTREGISRRADPSSYSGADLLELALSGMGGGTKIARGVGKGKFPFNLKETDFTYWDGILKKPAFYRKAAGVRRSIEFMSPKQYFQRLAKGSVGVSSKTQREILDKKLIEKYVSQMREGAKFPMPALEYRPKALAQEGRHRMVAAEKLGIDRVPVLIIRGK